MTTQKRIIEAFHIARRREPCNRVALIVAAVLHDAANGRGSNHHLGYDAQRICRRVRDRILRQREAGRDVTRIRLEI
jgi:UTP:GlnB (protein PII) uridylyltransferase